MKWEKQGERQASSKRLLWDTWNEWQRLPKDDEYSEKLNQINGVMEELGRPFGHRLFRSVHAYICNYPDKSAQESAFEDQFLMKLVPRLRGLETTQPSIARGLDKLSEFVPPTLKDAFEESKKQEFFQGINSSSLFE
jgi:hypothetical protein